jgi:predicted glycosyltransferase
MKILVDIGHPAHVHYFKNFIKKMKDKGLEFIITARDKEMTHYLLNKYNIDFFSRGKGGNTSLRKILYIIKADILIFLKALKFKPDLFISFSSIYAAHAAFLYRKPHIVMDDTEHSTKEQKLYLPFSKLVLNPATFRKDLGPKQIKMQTFFELTYLHPKYFSPDPSIKKELGLQKDEKYIVLRFISWGAAHDKKQSGLSMEDKRKTIEKLSTFGKIFISSEAELPEEFKSYQLKVAPERIHHVLYYASLFFGESGTMSTEAAILGTPTVRVSTLAKTLGNFQELQNKYKLLYFYDSGKEGLNKALELINNNNKSLWLRRKDIFIQNNVDITTFLVWLIENYPASMTTIKKDPSFQDKFISKE